MRTWWGSVCMLAAPSRADCADARWPPLSTGHGVCKLGFCKCDEGWFGHDCAYRMEGVAYTPGSASGGGVWRGHCCCRERTRCRLSNSAAHSRNVRVRATRRSPQAPTQHRSGHEETNRPWIKGQVHTPAAKDPEPGEKRLRPRIWVYELPSDYNTLLLQYRVAKYGAVGLDRSDCAIGWTGT